MTPEHERQEAERLSLLVERVRDKHARRPESVAVAKSLQAFRRWGVRPPASFTAQHRAVMSTLPGTFVTHGVTHANSRSD